MTRTKADTHGGGEPREEPLGLKDAGKRALLEGRVVITAMTTLFGFQLAVVFTDSFEKRLSEVDRQLHLASLGLVLVAIGLAMVPAAYGRQAEPRQASRRFVRIVSRVLTISLMPVLVALALDFRLIARMILGNGWLPTALATALAIYFFVLWYVFPRVRARALERQGLGAADDPNERDSSPPSGARESVHAVRSSSARSGR